MKDVQSTVMEGGYVMCEQPVSVKAPPQKRMVVIRAESRCLPSWKGCNNEESDVMGDKHRYRKCATS